MGHIQAQSVEVFWLLGAILEVSKALGGPKLTFWPFSAAAWVGP